MAPELFDNFTKFCKIRSNHEYGSDVLDLTDYRFFYPTTLLPILSFMSENGLKAKVHPNTHGYISAILNPSPYHSKTYVPFRELTPANRRSRETYLNEILRLTNKNYGGATALEYLLYELSTNIYEHSEFTNAYIMAQSYPSKHFTEICIFDNGISIPSSFLNHDIPFDTDEEAIIKAMEGISTKDEGGERGYGLSSIIKTFTEGSKGEILIVSKNGGTYISNRNQYSYELGDHFVVNGTLISLRIPKGSIDIYNYI